MARHAHPDRRHFWSSFAVAVLRASGGLALVVAVFMLVSSIERPPPVDGPVMLGGPQAASERDTRSSDPDLPSLDSLPEAPQGSVASEPVPADRTDVAAEDPLTGQPEGVSPEGLPGAAPAPADTTVQVLDGVGGSERLPLLVAALEELGYRVVATNPASADQEVTTVFYSEGREVAARALQARDPRIVEASPNVGFSPEVDLHVVLGADWQP